MLSRTKRIAVVALSLAVAASGFLPRLMTAAESGTQPATAPANAPAARSMQEIVKDLDAASDQLKDVMPSLESITKAEFRKTKGPQAIAPLKKISTLLHEIAVSQGIADAEQQRTQVLSFLVALGDEDSTKALQEMAGNKKDAAQAVSAQSGLALGNWIKNSEDAAAQQKVLEGYTAVAKANPEDEGVASTLMVMTQLGSANPDVTKKVVEVIRSTLKGEAAQGLVTRLDAMEARNALVGQALTVEGRTSTGGKLSTADMKGKVILLDFWATWCGPCVAELPNVKKVYESYHPKGLEIIGVDCDQNDSTVNEFIAKEGMPWPQLHDEDAQGKSEENMWHPLTKRFHVDGIPTMFLIDKKGVLRHVDARDDLEEKVQKLLAEKADGPATQPAGK